MTRVELALILKIIDSHIDSVQGLKEDIIKHYNEIMKNEGEETI